MYELNSKKWDYSSELFWILMIKTLTVNFNRDACQKLEITSIMSMMGRCSWELMLRVGRKWKVPKKPTYWGKLQKRKNIFAISCQQSTCVCFISRDLGFSVILWVDMFPTDEDMYMRPKRVAWNEFHSIRWFSPASGEHNFQDYWKNVF